MNVTLQSHLSLDIETLPVLLMNYRWRREQKWNRVWVNTVLKLTSRRIEIARSARGPKSQGPRAEDALAESYLVQKIYVI